MHTGASDDISEGNNLSVESTKERVLQKGNHGKRVQKRRKNDIIPNQPAKIPTDVPLPSDFPINKDGYLYTLANPDPIAMDTSFKYEDYINKPIPSKYYRAYNHKNVSLSFYDKAPQLKLLNDYTVVGCKGYSMVRATHGVTSGKYFYEVSIEEIPIGSAIRLGWAQKYASLQAPVGYDKFSYSLRSLHGTKFHQSIGYSYSEGYEECDIIGVGITLPQKNSLTPSLKNHTLVKFKSNFYFEERYYGPKLSKEVKPLPFSEITFFKNGKELEPAFKDIYEGSYYPAISLYKNAKVRVNFGPSFAYSPPAEFQPLTNRVVEEETERWLSDMTYLTAINCQ